MEVFDEKHFLDSGATPENLEREREREREDFSSEVDSRHYLKKSRRSFRSVLTALLVVAVFTDVSCGAEPGAEPNSKAGLGDVLSGRNTAGCCSCCVRPLKKEVGRLRIAAGVTSSLSCVFGMVALAMGELSSEAKCNGAVTGFTGNYNELKKSCGIGDDGEKLADMSWASIILTWGVVISGGLSTFFSTVAKYQIRSAKKQQGV